MRNVSPSGQHPDRPGLVTRLALAGLAYLAALLLGVIAQAPAAGR